MFCYALIFIILVFYSITYLLVGNTIAIFYLKFVTATNLVSYFLFWSIVLFCSANS